MAGLLRILCAKSCLVFRQPQISSSSLRRPGRSERRHWARERCAFASPLRYPGLIFIFSTSKQEAINLGADLHRCTPSPSTHTHTDTHAGKIASPIGLLRGALIRSGYLQRRTQRRALRFIAKPKPLMWGRGLSAKHTSMPPLA